MEKPLGTQNYHFDRRVSTLAKPYTTETMTVETEVSTLGCRKYLNQIVVQVNTYQGMDTPCMINQPQSIIHVHYTLQTNAYLSTKHHTQAIHYSHLKTV